uniref:Zinc finger C-x8-C-x5-C-x3-H type protein n=1 Tax=Mimivirus LCMiAC02 TaxID=2506609 RepID=A0A481Z3J1_9VIRU|nr:MAG: zinc finger C-x8-C-x5-C-x3-H type protein [Mimivirus LCMiAC02]
MRQYNKYNRGNFNKRLSNRETSNKKRILCYNILHDKSCKYGIKCDYAHGLNDQIKDPIRDKVYNMLKENIDMRSIDLIHDKELYNTLIVLTRVCKECSKNLCPGGHNCRIGALNEKYRICYDDMMFGTCSRGECKYIHLTNKGLIPYIIQKKIYDNKFRPNKFGWNILKQVTNNVINKNNNTNIRNNEHMKMNKNMINNILDGSLLTDKILRSYLDNDKLDNSEDYDSDDLFTEDFKMEMVDNYINNAKNISYDEFVKLEKNKNNKDKDIKEENIKI